MLAVLVLAQATSSAHLRRLLTDPSLELGPRQGEKVKRVAHERLDKFKREKLALDWRKKQQTRAAVHVTIRDVLAGLPRCYTPGLFNRKRQEVYQHVYDSYCGAGRSVYQLAA